MSDDRTTPRTYQLTIKLVETGYRRFWCFNCGHETEKALIQAIAYNNRGAEQGKVCNACLESPAVFRARGAAYAADLRWDAELLERTEVVAMPTVNDKWLLADAMVLLAQGVKP